jgi:hypothetical protein
MVITGHNNSRGSPLPLPTSSSEPRLRRIPGDYGAFPGPCHPGCMDMDMDVWRAVSGAVLGLQEGTAMSRYVRYVRKVAIIGEFYRARDELALR